MKGTLKAKREAYKQMQITLENFKKAVYSQIRTIDEIESEYNRRLQYDYTGARPPYPEYNKYKDDGYHSAVYSQESKGRKTDSRAKAPNRAYEPGNEGGRREKTDGSIKSNLGQNSSIPTPDGEDNQSSQYKNGSSNGDEEEEDSQKIDVAEDFTPISVSNSNFNSDACWFIKPKKAGGSKDKTALYFREIQLGEPSSSLFMKHRITALTKQPGDSHANMALWTGGQHELITLIKDKASLAYFQDPQAQPQGIITLIGYLNSHIIFFTAKLNILVMDLSGTLKFKADIRSLFKDKDQVVCSLSETESNSLILGTQDGVLMTLKIDFNQRTISSPLQEKYNVRRVSSMAWVDEESKDFILSSNEKKILLLRFFDVKRVEVLSVFNYDSTVKCCIKMDNYLLAGFGNDVVSIVDQERGEILISMTVPNRQKSKPNEGNYINWLGYLLLGDRSEYIKAVPKKGSRDLDEFKDYLAKVRFICKYDNGEIIIFGWPNNQKNIHSIKLFHDFPQQIIDSRRMPVIFERFEDTRIRLRTFAIVKDEQFGRGREGGAPGEEKIQSSTWMGEIDIQLCEIPLNIEKAPF
jgi:hypothetical protein